MSDTPEDARQEQLLRAAGSTPADAAPRITVTEHDGNTRIDIADTAAVRPGPGPGADDSIAAAQDNDTEEARNDS